MSNRKQKAVLGAAAAAIAVWFAETAVVHALGFSGFAGAGWITALFFPFAAGIGVFNALDGG